MAMPCERQSEINGYGRFPHSAFRGGDGYDLADGADGAFLGQTALAAGERGRCAGAREALRWGWTG